MPKKGEFLPYRVVYDYPNGVRGREAYFDYYEAEGVAGGVGRRGGIVTVLRVEKPRDKQGEILAMFGPDQRHYFRIVDDPKVGGKKAFKCSCEFITRTDVAVEAHIMHAGLCYVCWGNTIVNERVTGFDGKPLVGDPTGCPVCGDNGTEDEMSFDGVDMALYLTHLQVLELISS